MFVFLIIRCLLALIKLINRSYSNCSLSFINKQNKWGSIIRPGPQWERGNSFIVYNIWIKKDQICFVLLFSRIEIGMRVSIKKQCPDITYKEVTNFSPRLSDPNEICIYEFIIYLSRMSIWSVIHTILHIKIYYLLIVLDALLLMYCNSMYRTTPRISQGVLVQGTPLN